MEGTAIWVQHNEPNIYKSILHARNNINIFSEIHSGKPLKK